jgi:hypothetical protein
MSALARIKKTAAQHEQERQYDKALALYARLLDGAEAGGEEVDVALFNRAGDLALRLGDAPRAVGYFERALDLYAAAGLLNNAVALGVKILRHAPHHLSAHYTLGVLYGRKGFVGDSRQHLLTYAVQMQRAGRVDETGRVLAEVAATCADTAELRAAQDAFGAMGGDPAHAAALAAGPSAAPSAARRSPPASVAAIPAFEFLDATPGAGAPRRPVARPSRSRRPSRTLTSSSRPPRRPRRRPRSSCSCRTRRTGMRWPGPTSSSSTSRATAPPTTYRRSTASIVPHGPPTCRARSPTSRPHFVSPTSRTRAGGSRPRRRPRSQTGPRRPPPTSHLPRRSVRRPAASPTSWRPGSATWVPRRRPRRPQTDPRRARRRSRPTTTASTWAPGSARARPPSRRA